MGTPSRCSHRAEICKARSVCFRERAVQISSRTHHRKCTGEHLQFCGHPTSTPSTRQTRGPIETGLPPIDSERFSPSSWRGHNLRFDAALDRQLQTQSQGAIFERSHNANRDSQRVLDFTVGLPNHSSSRSPRRICDLRIPTSDKRLQLPPETPSFKNGISDQHAVSSNDFLIPLATISAKKIELVPHQSLLGPWNHSSQLKNCDTGVVGEFRGGTAVPVIR